MKIVHLVPHIDKEAAGPSYTVPRLCDALHSRGDDVTLMCLKAGKNAFRFRLELYKQLAIAGNFGFSVSLSRALAAYSAHAEIIHNHSLWAMPNMAAGIVGIGKKAKFVISPHGAVAPWALSHHKLRKKIFWPLQRRALFKADLVHATGRAEFDDIRALGVKAPVVILPNGVDVPFSTMKKPINKKVRTLLFLGRLHPVKGIDKLIRAWSTIFRSNEDWELVIAGVGTTAYEAELAQLISALKVERCRMTGPVYGQEKTATYLSADLLVMPSHTENFGMVAAEALAHGCPAIVGKGAPWEKLKEKKCGWWISNDIDTLSATLNQALNLPRSELAQMGENGREWMLKEFSWNVIAEKMAAAYRWVVFGGVKPEWIEA